MASDLDAARQGLERFILESIRLDALLDARVRDIDFIRSGGEVYYTPDHSTWSAFFFPVKDGQEDRGKKGNSIPGFAEVYLDSDRSDGPYVSDSPLTGRQVTGMLGKILMDAIFDAQNATESAPDFFLTDESKEGLNAAIRFALAVRNRHSRNVGSQRDMALAFQALQREFAEADNSKISSELFVESPDRLAKSGMLKILLDDENITNLSERSRVYNDIGFFDWDYVVSEVQDGVVDGSTFGLSRADLGEFERLRDEFFEILKEGTHSPNRKMAVSMADILAMNVVVGARTDFQTRFVYLTNSPVALRLFDRFEWSEGSDHPLRMVNGPSRSSSVSLLFVRSPLCFLHDIELRPEKDVRLSPLKAFVDSVVPRRYHDVHRIGTNDAIKRSIHNGVSKTEPAKVGLYAKELKNFYERWGAKKIPWVNVFLKQRGGHWVDGLSLFSIEGFHGFWRKINRDFARHSWQLGIFLAQMSEDRTARAAPLVFIDCDGPANEMLSAMQDDLAGGDIEKFQGQIERFVQRPAERDSEERNEYFDSLVNAVLFMFSNQFETSRFHAENATDLAVRSMDPEITGREAYFLRSHLVRVTARDRGDLEVARKLMLIARGKRDMDNERLSEGRKVSSIRFDLEDWSRRIVGALGDHFESGDHRTFPASLMREYLVFVRKRTNAEFYDLGLEERHSLYEQICERMRFNFLVLAVTMDDSNDEQSENSRVFLEKVVSEWNHVFGKEHGGLAIKVYHDELERASTIEHAYLLALAAGVPNAEFVHISNVVSLVSEFFGEECKGSLASATTSFVDQRRYESLQKYCLARVGGLGVDR